jgi:hypothetical protein
MMILILESLPVMTLVCALTLAGGVLLSLLAILVQPGK